MVKKLGLKIDLEVSREFLEFTKFNPKDYLSGKVLADHRVAELLANNENVSIAGPFIKDISDRTKGMRAGDLYKYSWIISSLEI